MIDLADYIRDVPDFPKPGIVFKDITPLLGDTHAFRSCIQRMAEPLRTLGIEKICGVESRGFIFGAAVACELGAGFVPIRKPGKLPARTHGVDYALEYGSDRVEIHADALGAGARTVLVDDVIATGGTLMASRRLLELLGAELVAASVVIELDFLNARAGWPAQIPLRALLHF